jgi:hypothetical protein
VFGDELSGHADEGLGLLAEEPGGDDEPFDVPGRGGRERPRVGIPIEERRRDLVDARVGRLRGEDGGDQQLEGVPIVKLGVGAGVFRLEEVDDPLRRSPGLQ